MCSVDAVRVVVMINIVFICSVADAKRDYLNHRVIEPAHGTSDTIRISVPNFGGVLHIFLREGSPRVQVIAQKSVMDPGSPAAFFVTALGVGNPGEPAAILKFESDEQVEFNLNGVRQSLPVLSLEVAVWIEPVRGSWISGKGDPRYELGIVATHAVMFPTATGSKLLFWSPARERSPSGEGGFARPDDHNNGNFVWLLANTEVIEVTLWSPWHLDEREDRPMLRPFEGRAFNLFCSGQVLLASGRAIMAGGHIGNGPSAGDHVWSFNLTRPPPFDWQIEGGHLAGRRWYPTQATLPSGRVLVVSGLNDSLGYLPKQDHWAAAILANIFSGGLYSAAQFAAGNDPALTDVAAPLGPPLQDRFAVTQFDIVDPFIRDVVDVPEPRPELISDRAQAAYPGVYVLPAPPMREKSGGAVFVCERRFGYLFDYSRQEDNVDIISPAGIAVTIHPAQGFVPERIDRAPNISVMNSHGSRYWPWYAVSLLLPFNTATPQKARVLVAGGAATAFSLDQISPGNATTGAAEIFDYDAQLGINRQTPWRNIDPMRFGRILSDATILTDGNVLVTGGADRGYANDSLGQVRRAELFDSERETWSTMEASPTDRRYHSVALLLEDGTVFNAGSHGGLIPDRNNIQPQFHADIFRPSYLYRSPRPVVVAASEPLRADGATRRLRYGAQHYVDVASDDSRDFFRLALARFGGITHGNYMDQRFIWVKPDRVRFLGRQPNGAYWWRMLFTIPDHQALLPPGNFMLFVLNRHGTPSIGTFVVMFEGDDI